MAVKIKPNKAVIRDKTEGLKMFIFGKPNIGKTTFASSFPNAIILNTDGNLTLFETPSYNIKAWRYGVKLGKIGIKEENCFVDVLEALLEDTHDFDTLVVEIGSHIYQYMREYTLGKLNIEDETDLGYGKGWQMVTQEFNSVMLKLFTSKYNVIFITHEKNTEVESRKKKVTIPVSDMREGVQKLISGLCQITGRLTVKEEFVDGKRVLNRVIEMVPEDDFEIIGNKIGITEELKLEQGYEYEDLVSLINDGVSIKK